MRSASNSPLTTLLIFIPLLAVPLLAVFGIPQLEPTAASSSRGASIPDVSSEVGVGESIHYGAADLFAPVRESGTDGSERDSRWPARQNRPNLGGSADGAGRGHGGRSAGIESATAQGAGGRSGRGRLETNPFEPLPNGPDGQPPTQPTNWSPPPDALQGWSLESDTPHPPTERKEGRGGLSARLQGVSVPDGAETADGGLPSAASASPLTWQEAVRRLHGLGIRDFQLQPGRGQTEFHFSCSFTPPEHPRILHRFEAEADQPLDAVQDVLTQVENWKNRR